MSPLGTYPKDTFIGIDAAICSTPDICFSMVSLKHEQGSASFSEIDYLHPSEIPLLGALMLAVEDGERYIFPYPTHQEIVFRTASCQLLDAAVVDDGHQQMRAYVKRCKLEEDLSDSIHRPPVAGGVEYEVIASKHRDVLRNKILNELYSADPITIRGLASLVKANTAWEHAEFREAACVSLWISLDAIHSLILRRLVREGAKNPSSEDASDYVAACYKTDFDGSIFEDHYWNRISVIHPDNRFGAAARPQLLADDFYELRHLVVELFRFLVTGTQTISRVSQVSCGHGFHQRPL